MPAANAAACTSTETVRVTRWRQRGRASSVWRNASKAMVLGSGRTVVAGVHATFLPIARLVNGRLPLRGLVEQCERLLLVEQVHVDHGVGVARAQRQRLVEVADAFVCQVDAQAAADVVGCQRGRTGRQGRTVGAGAGAGSGGLLASPVAARRAFGGGGQGGGARPRVVGADLDASAVGRQQLPDERAQAILGVGVAGARVGRLARPGQRLRPAPLLEEDLL